MSLNGVIAPSSEEAKLLKAKECLRQLTRQTLRKFDDLPDAIGVYALADHTDAIHYIGITAAKSFRDRIYQRHINGSEERSHKLACNYNIGRMWRDRKCPAHVPQDAKIAKHLRREFTRRHCRVAYVPISAPKQELEVLEKELLRIAPPDLVSWNATRRRVNRLPEPRFLVDDLIQDLGFTLAERAALDRQEQLFALYGDK